MSRGIKSSVIKFLLSTQIQVASRGIWMAVCCVDKKPNKNTVPKAKRNSIVLGEVEDSIADYALRSVLNTKETLGNYLAAR